MYTHYIDESNMDAAKIYSLVGAKKGISITNTGKISLVRVVNHGHVPAVPITESVFDEMILSAQKAGVRNISASAMKVLFADSNADRAHLLGIRRSRSTFTVPWVRFTDEAIPSDTLKQLGMTTKCLVNLLANGIIKKSEAM